jgi:glycosyltransferase involved in cell wall biosynthesis
MSTITKGTDDQHPQSSWRAEDSPPVSVRARRRPLHVAVVDEELPYPPVTGKRLRTFKLLIRLARDHRITYLCHRNADRDEARRAATLFADHGIETILVDRSVPRKSGAFFYGRLAANLLSPLPYSVTSHQSQALRQAIHAYAAAHRVDLWQCEWTPYAWALRGLSNARRLLVAQNVESQIWQRYHETEKNPVKRWYIKKQWDKFRQFEQQSFAEADQIIAVSAEDAALITGGFGGRQPVIVDNGVDTDYFRPMPGPREAGRILFLGSLDWRPNLDAVQQLLDRVFPAVLNQEPLARLVLVGRNPPLWLRSRVAETTSVELHADVSDVRPHLARSGVMAVPLRIGGGSRLKILEALAVGLPVVSTRIGAEGLCLDPEQHLKVVADVEEMAAALVEAVRHPGPARAAAERGRRRVLERYGWETLALQLEQIWLESADRAPPSVETPSGRVP